MAEVFEVLLLINVRFRVDEAPMAPSMVTLSAPFNLIIEGAMFAVIVRVLLGLIVTEEKFAAPVPLLFNTAMVGSV
jgi:hypothetical protein